MPKTRVIPFKTKLTEHIHLVHDGKSRKIPAIALLYQPGAYHTLTHTTYTSKTNESEFCILFSTLLNHHIDEKTEKLVLDEGYGKTETRVISKNIRHAPEIMDFFQEYEQRGKDKGKKMTLTLFDN